MNHARVYKYLMCARGINFSSALLHQEVESERIHIHIVLILCARCGSEMPIRTRFKWWLMVEIRDIMMEYSFTAHEMKTNRTQATALLPASFTAAPSIFLLRFDNRACDLNKWCFPARIYIFAYIIILFSYKVYSHARMHGHSHLRRDRFFRRLGNSLHEGLTWNQRDGQKILVLVWEKITCIYNCEYKAVSGRWIYCFICERTQHKG